MAVLVGLSWQSPLTAQADCVPAPGQIVSWWRAENDAHDSIGASHGTLQNGAAFTTGKVGQAFRFDGVNDLIDLGASLPFRRSDAITYTFWARLPADAGAFTYVLGAGAVNGQGFGGVLIDRTNFWYGWTPTDPPADTTVRALGISTPTNEWTHFAVTMDYTNRVAAMYVNGQAVPIVVSNTLALPLVDWTPKGVFNIGLHDSIGGRFVNTPQFFKGDLDEVDVYGRALNPAEIAAIFAAGSAGKCKPCRPSPPDQIAWWSFEENTPFIAGDYVGGVQASYFTNGLAVPPGTSVGSTVVPGKVRLARRLVEFEALRGDGSGALNLQSNQVTIETWLRLEPNPTLANRFTASCGKLTFPDKQAYMITFESGPNVGLPTNQWQFEYILTRTDGFRAHNQSTGVYLEVDGQFHHVAMTYDGATVVLYVDGVQRGAYGYTGNLLAVPAEPVAMGGTAPFSVDELGIYRRALSAAEIATIYNAGSEGKCRFFMDWTKLAGGGGTSADGGRTLRGTIGQPDAGGPMTNSQFSVTGGFWALPTAIQVTGAPTLTIASATPGNATISWSPNTPGFVLQETLSLSPTNWVNSPSGATNPVIVPATLPTKFYRLFKP